MSIEEIRKEQRKLEREIADIRAKVNANENGTARAHQRIDAIEQRLSDVSASIQLLVESTKSLSSAMDDIKKKQDNSTFQQKVIIGLLLIIGALVGIKIPLF